MLLIYEAYNFYISIQRVNSYYSDTPRENIINLT